MGLRIRALIWHLSSDLDSRCCESDSNIPITFRGRTTRCFLISDRSGAFGEHVAIYTSGTTYFIHGDHLATERNRTNVSGGSIETCTSLAFGDHLSCTGTDVSPLHFTGKERDVESGLDNF